VDADVVRGWIKRGEAEVRGLAEQAEVIQGQLAEARRQLMLLYEMLAAATNAPVAVSAAEMGLARSTRERVWAHTEEILRAHGRPMRVQDIHAEFVRRRFALPGRGTPTNIVAHLVASNRFSRPRRGVYSLAEWESTSHSAEAESPATMAPTDVAGLERAPPRQGCRARHS
jgi:hypothetical protein